MSKSVSIYKYLSIFLITSCIVLFSNHSYSETTSKNSPESSKGPRKIEHSLENFILNSPNPEIDVLYVTQDQQPVFIKNMNMMPIHPELKKKLEAEGKLKELTERLNALKSQHNKAGNGIDQPKRNSSSSKAFATLDVATGTQRALVLFVDFSDHTSKTALNSFNTLLFGTGSSMQDFYYKSSFNKLFIEGTAMGWYRAPQNYAYYVDGNNGFNNYPKNAQGLVYATVSIANPFVDFSQYDSNHDTYVDTLFVVHSGPGAEYTGTSTDIWSHQWSLPSPYTVDGVKVDTYSMEPEYWVVSGDMTIGVFCHELGHVFGLPDFYDTDYSSEGLGNWSLMAGGSWNGNNGNQPSHFDAWCKTQLGWVTPIVPSSNIVGATITASETTQCIYKLWTDGTASNQYFLVENRQKLGYDSGIPATGLAIYHVDDSQSSNDNEWYPTHTGSGHFWVALEQADGLFQLEKYTNGGNGGDPWPGTSSKTVFDLNSTPDTKSYAGTVTKVAVKNISSSSVSMTADISVANPVSVEKWQQYGDPSLFDKD